MPIARNRLIPLTTRIFPSSTSSAISFKCEALEVGADNSAAVWRITRVVVLDVNRTDEDVLGSRFDAICDDRESLPFPPAPFINVNAIEFLGVNEHMVVATDPIFSYENTTPFSISLWIRRESGVVQAIIDKQDSSGGLFRGWATVLVSDKYRFIMRSDNNINDRMVVDSNLSMPLSTYIHTVMTKGTSKAASSVKMYFNGVVNNTTVVDDLLVGTTVSSGPLRFGLRDGGAIPFEGLQDEAVFYDKELTALEVGTVFANAKKNLLDTALAGNITNYWHNGDGDTFPNIIDVVGGNNALMTNMVPGNIVSIVP